jgi:hypothetical protein
MATTTARLALRKPDPNPTTGDFIDVAADINAGADKIDAAVGAEPCTAATRPASPYHGKIIRETDTRKVYVWNATQAVWDQILATGAVFGTAVDVQRAVTTNPAHTSEVAGDTQKRLIWDASGGLTWGSGAATGDVNLFRQSAGQLASNGSLTLHSGKPVCISENGLSQSAPAVTINTGTYANIGSTFSIIKRYSSTESRLAIDIQIGFRVGAATNGLRVGVLINGVDTDVTQQEVTTANLVNSHMTMTGFQWIPGLAAGTYTVQMRGLRFIGASNIVIDSTDWFAIRAREVSLP